jgi:hypothetical protein
MVNLAQNNQPHRVIVVWGTKLLDRPFDCRRTFRAPRVRERKKECGWITDATGPSTVRRQFSPMADHYQKFRFETACTTGTGYRFATNVPVLRIDHLAVEVFLSGMREVSRSD